EIPSNSRDLVTTGRLYRHFVDHHMSPTWAWVAAALLPLAAFAQDEEIQAGASRPASSLVHLSGYVDFGLAKADNGGKGFIIDKSAAFSSRFPGVAWILLGDPWSTAVNSRGEPADTSGSFAFKEDPINS